MFVFITLVKNYLLHTFIIIFQGYIDIKIEGLNGQLPNLDLVNLAERISTMERIRHTFKQRSQNIKTDAFNKWFHSFETLISMVLSLATGVCIEFILN